MDPIGTDDREDSVSVNSSAYDELGSIADDATDEPVSKRARVSKSFDTLNDEWEARYRTASDFRSDKRMSLPWEIGYASHVFSDTAEGLVL